MIPTFHLCITWALIGLIWTIQVVHYPLFKCIGESHFHEYHEKHMRFISWLVAPLMLAEVGSAGLMLFLGERSIGFLISLIGMGLIWASTFFLQVPLHEKIYLSYCPTSIDKLVRTNWLRTLAWTARGIILIPAFTSIS